MFHKYYAKKVNIWKKYWDEKVRDNVIPEICYGWFINTALYIKKFLNFMTQFSETKIAWSTQLTLVFKFLPERDNHGILKTKGILRSCSPNT